MRSTVGKWIAPFVVVDVDPAEFDGPDADRLLERLDKHFMMPVAMTTPDWQAKDGVRAKGAYIPIAHLTDPTFQWRDLSLPDDPDELPF